MGQINFEEMLDMKTLAEIKQDWLTHNLVNGLSTNELTELINEVWNLAIEKAAEEVKADLYTQGTYKGAKWIKLKLGDSYDPTERSIMAKVDKQSILKLKV